MELKALVQKRGCVIAKNDKKVFAVNPDVELIPASVLKILTSLAAVERLGQDFRFATEFYMDERDNLYIKGLGDPFPVSEEITVILEDLKDLHIGCINNIYLDDSAFEAASPPAGAADTLRPYNVMNGALVGNFNTINLVVSKDGTIRSGENRPPPCRL